MYLKLLFALISTFSLVKSGVVFENGVATLRMANGTVAEEEERPVDLIPTEQVLGGKKVGYITRFEPLPDKLYVSHIDMDLCHNVTNYLGPKTCPTCQKSREIYHWAYGGIGYVAPLEFPPGLSVKLNSSEYEFIRLELHYYKSNPYKEEDQSSLKLTIQEEPTELECKEIFFVRPMLNIPPGRRSYSVDVNCKLKADITTFAELSHTHKLGRLITAYLWNHETGNITEISRRNPQNGQSILPIQKKVNGKKDDIIHVRCTFNSESQTDVYHDEMCEFHLTACSPEGSAVYQRCTKVEDVHVYNLLPKDSNHF